MNDKVASSANRLRAAVLQRVLEARGLPAKIDAREMTKLKGRMAEIYGLRREAAVTSAVSTYRVGRSTSHLAYLGLIWALLFLVLAELSRR